MSEFHVRVVRVGEVRAHPNADSLSITDVDGGYPVIFRTGDFQSGDLAAYLPVDSVVRVSDPKFAFLANKDKPREMERIRAKRLRGSFSMGMLVKADPSWALGQRVQDELGVTKYEPPEPSDGDEKDPGFIPVYTDIEGLRAHGDLLRDGEEVVLTEKIHGANGRWCFHEGRLWCGSHTRTKQRDPNNGWWRVADRHNLETKLATVPGIVIYGEVYGNVGGFKYGADKGDLKLILFDALDIKTNEYLEYDDFLALAKKLELPTVPELYRGPWSLDLKRHADGNTTLGSAHIREGFVVRPILKRFEPTLGGRCILKLHSEAFLLQH